MQLLERSAADVNAATGCLQCPLLRDRYSGWGQLNVDAALKALAGPIPPRDRYEGNDDAGTRAFTLWGRSNRIVATLDFWDDQIDVYRIRLRKGQTVAVSLRGPARTNTNLVLWEPGTIEVEGLSPQVQARRVTQSVARRPERALPAPGERGRLVLRRGEDDDAELGRLHAAHLEEPGVKQPLSVGVQLPEAEREVRWPEYVAMARAAEESGFDSIWLGDHLLYRGDGREERGPWEMWTLLAALPP